jgi:hypothetical protein
MQHPLEHGQTFQSPGCHFTYRVIGPCCRLFDREELPWPCCRLQWHGKEPSWRRIGRRFVPDLATKSSPSYAVEVVGQEYVGRTFVVTLYAVKLPQPIREWWYAKTQANQAQNHQAQNHQAQRYEPRYEPSLESVN